MLLNQSFRQHNIPIKRVRVDNQGGDGLLDRNHPHHLSQQNSQDSNNSGNNDEALPVGVYENGRIVHTMGTLFGSVVQVLLKDGITWEGVLKTFSPDFEIALDAAIQVNTNTPSEGGNIGHLISSLSSGNQQLSQRVFKLEEVVVLNILNTDMDYASRGHFVTDTELSKGKIDLSEERKFVPWTSDEPLDEVCDSLGSTSGTNGWAAEDMFAQNEKLGVISGFQDIDGTYTMSLANPETPEETQKRKERERLALAIAKEIEDNPNSRRRTEHENSDDRTEEEKWSGVDRTDQHPPQPTAPQHQQRWPQKHQPPSRSEDPNWRRPEGRNQNMVPKGPFQKGPFVRGGPSTQAGHPRDLDRRDSREDAARGTGPQKRQSFPQLQSPPHQHQPPLIPPHHQHHQHLPPSPMQQHQPSPLHQHRPILSSQGLVTSPKDELPKSVAAQGSPATPNYARAVAQDQDQRTSNKTSVAKEQQRRRDAEIADIQQKLSELKVSTPTDAEKKDLPQTWTPSSAPPPPPAAKSAPPEKTQVSSTESQEQERQRTPDEGKATEGNVDKKSNEPDAASLAKTSKLNPNAKEFTFNPEAKPFTPRSSLPAVSAVSPQAIPQQVGTYSPQAVAPAPVPMTVASGVHQPQHMMHMAQHAIHRMPGANQPVLLQQAMVSPAGNIIPPYHVMMTQYPQMTVNPATGSGGPGPGGGGGRQNKGFKNQNHNNRNEHQTFAQNSQHNAAAVTGHPVLAAAPFPYPPQQPGQMFSPMYQVHPGFNPRMPHHPMSHQVSYDPSHSIYMGIPGAIPMVASPMAQQNNGHHSNPSTPQSQTPNTAMHGGPSTPGPAGHMVAGQSQTPTPQQAVIFSGQNLPPHSIAGAFNSQHQNMVLMQGHPGQPHAPQGPGPVQHPGVHVSQGHPMPIIPVIQQTNATPLVMQHHFQPNPTGR